MAVRSGKPDALLSTSHQFVSSNGGPNAPALAPAWFSDHPTCLPMIDLAMSVQLGLPLIFCLYTPAPNSSVTIAKYRQDLIDTPRNTILHTLSTSQNSDGQMSNGQIYGIARPNVLISRADGKELCIEHVTATCEFVDEMQDKTSTVDSFFAEATRENFIDFWTKHPVYSLHDGGCPVKIDPDEPDPLGFVVCLPKKEPHVDPILKIHLPALFRSFTPPNAASAGLSDLPLHITARLGLPLVFSICMSYPGDDNSEEDAVLIDSPYNPILHRFSIQRAADGVIESQKMVNGQQPEIALRRADGKRLTVDQAMVMWMFVEEEATKVEKMTNPTRSDWEAFLAKMTPENFVARWGKADVLQWARGECPVKLGCKVWGNMAGAKLLRCGKCGFAKYCGKECQKTDWKLHKKLCHKWELKSSIE